MHYPSSQTGHSLPGLLTYAACPALEASIAMTYIISNPADAKKQFYILWKFFFISKINYKIVQAE